MTTIVETHPVLVALARWVVNGERPVEAFDEPPDWIALCEEAQRHRLAGALLAAVDDGWIIVTPAGRDHLDEIVTSRMRRCLTIEAAVIDTARTLGDAGVPMFLLKGIAAAHLDYQDPTFRAFNDADILIPADRLNEALVVLECAGLERDLPARSPSWDARFAKDIPMFHPAGVEIDLHRSLAPGAFGFWIDPDELMADPVPLKLSGNDLMACGRLARAFHAVMGITVAESHLRLAHVVDLALLTRGMAEPHLLRDLCRRAKASMLYSEAVAIAECLLAAPLTVAWGVPLSSESVEPTRRERMARNAYRSSGGAHVRELLTGFLALGSSRNQARYARALFLPSRSYRQARRRVGRAPEWREGARQLVPRRVAKR